MWSVIMNDLPEVSVVVPIYNEEKYIEQFLISLSDQDYPKNLMEIILVDGMSLDKTRAKIVDFSSRYHNMNIIILDNENKTVPYAMNIGIKRATTDYIVRLDAHAEYPKDYIRLAIEELLQRPEVANVGGYAITKGRGEMGSAIAAMLSSPFGVGNSSFRTEGDGGYVDTVPFGVFRREVFDVVGGYDRRLTRNQDNEMNGRIRDKGYKIYLSPRIQFTYWCRDSISGICKMARQNGYWNILTAKISSSAMGLRHFIPMIFVSTIVLAIVGLLVSWFLKWTFLFGLTLILFSMEMILYFILALYFASKCRKKYRASLYLYIFLFLSFHINYGFSSFRAIFAHLPEVENATEL